MGYLTGKKILILGVASKLSIASGIAEAMHREGAELAFTYQNDRLKDRVLKFAESWGLRSRLPLRRPVMTMKFQTCLPSSAKAGTDWTASCIVLLLPPAMNSMVIL